MNETAVPPIVVGVEAGQSHDDSAQVGESPCPGAGDSAQLPFVSIVIPMYNESRYISACLGSLLKQDYPKDRYEVLVVDGGSNDGSTDIVRNYNQAAPAVRVIDNPKRIIPAAFNSGVENARGDVIYFLGAHSTVWPDFLSKTVTTLRESGADCVGGTIETVGGSFAGQAIATALSHPFGVGNSRYRYSTKAGFVDTVGFGAFRRDVFDRIGRFDEAFARSNEDYEFNYRLRKAGGKVYLNPQIRASYFCRSTLVGLVKQYFRYGLWKTEVILMHPGAFQIRHQVPPLFILALIAGMVLAPFHPAGTVLLLALLCAYLSVVLLVSLSIIARKRKLWGALLPVVFVGLHFSFGTGLLCRLVRRLPGLLWGAVRRGALRGE